jgi:hypothetical protein
MRRFVGPGLGMLLGWIVALPAAGQGASTPPAITLSEPRPNPVLPAALVPFSVSSDLCRRGHIPRVALRVYNVFAQPVARLNLRDRRTVSLDSIPMKCGDYVAVWDGTVDGGTRVASPGIYYMVLGVDGRTAARKVIITSP